MLKLIMLIHQNNIKNSIIVLYSSTISNYSPMVLLKENYGTDDTSWNHPTSTGLLQQPPELSSSSMEHQSDDTNNNNPSWVNKNNPQVIYQNQPPMANDSVFNFSPSTIEIKNSIPKPKRNTCHNFFIFIQILGALANLTMIMVQIVPLFICDKMVFLQIIVR